MKSLVRTALAAGVVLAATVALTAPASAYESVGARSCAANYKVSVASTVTISGYSGSYDASHTYISGQSQTTRTVTGTGLKRSFGPYQFVSRWSAYSPNRPISGQADCSNTGV
ncbi:hypothetical protein [Cellulomonas soli]|uniref:Lactococcin 972 family bacteriocin n=1 Tax=Cellulomonas soli TaxID=931535 RepID=A0A512PCX8_9CELL|nr:hypothetical protein [Cellulomonas soli]NYI58639.1 hypothetical protein [Cellulomonas soli]GEP69064.1 hypothetical protein CSO01_17790 [Cellulomonas soli]